MAVVVEQLHIFWFQQIVSQHLRCAIWIDIPNHQRRRWRCVHHLATTFSSSDNQTHGQESRLTLSKAMPAGSSVASWMQSNIIWLHITWYALRIQTVLCWKNQTRFLNLKLAEHFQKRNLFFKATYITTVRDWTGNLPNFATTSGAYRKRNKDEKEIPHSFTFLRRDCPLTA